MLYETRFKTVFNKTWQAFRFIIPILCSVLLVVAFVQAIVPVEAYKKIFTGNLFLDPLIGALLGSVSLGNPIVSYIIADKLLSNGIEIVAITAFIIAWVTVGIIQLPAESFYFGKRFALVRTLTSFLSAIAIGLIIGYIV